MTARVASSRGNADQTSIEGLHSFLRDCTGIVGDDHVLSHESSLYPYRQNLSGLQRRIPAVVRPGSTRDVQAIVRRAASHRVAVYPISTGKNWGLGSTLPVQDDSVILDLRRLNRIREVNEKLGYAVVEPGVTQRQLYDHLRAERSDLYFDLTGSGSDTSILGNTVDSGVGYRKLRIDSLTGMEVVLASGELLRTGYGHFGNACAEHLFRHGVGPSVDGMFVQSNLGIVTAIGIELRRRQEAFLLAVFRVDRDDELERLVDTLRELKADGIIEAFPRIGNRERTRTTLCPLIQQNLGRGGRSATREEVEQLFRSNFGSWSAVVGLDGTRRRVRDSHREIRRRIAGIARVSFVSEESLRRSRKLCSLLGRLEYFRRQGAVVASIYPLFNLSRGVPTDATLAGLYWSQTTPPADPTSPDLDDVGKLAYCTMIPANGEGARLVVLTAERVFRCRRFAPSITLTLLDPRAMWGVIDLSFLKSDGEQRAAAHEAVDALQHELMREGIYPQRVGIQSMPGIVNEEDPYWRFIKRLKSTLDPRGVLAPGRYSS